MNLWVIALVIGMMVLAGVALSVSEIGTAQSTDSESCTSCENSCTAESNCGLASCGAVNGKSCGCGN